MYISNLKINSYVAQNFKVYILSDYLRTSMSIPAPVLKALWQKKEDGTLLSTFQEKKTACENIKCLKSDLTSFIMGTLQLNNEFSPKFVLIYAFHILNGLIVFFPNI